MSVYDKYEVVVGLEVHAQLLTKSKAYSADANQYGEEPNTLVSPVTLGLPGALPVMNKKSVELAIRMGFATSCSIRTFNAFSRKNYFYADLPKGYQITQFDTPICNDGFIEIQVQGVKKKIEIERIHLEEDAGKSIHDIDPFHTLVDLNRAGVPLIEIVSRPDIRSSDEAHAYLTEIRKLVRYLDVCDGNMEEGSLRCDANISVRLKGASAFGQRVEVKNMNSIRNVKKAIEHEFIRQIDVIEAGGKIFQETRNFDAVTGTTSSMRTKELAHDYRYFPEPDLLPVVLTESYLQEVKSQMPALPSELKLKFQTEWNLSEYDATLLTEDKKLAEYMLALTDASSDPKASANWLLGPVKAWMNEYALEMNDFPIPVTRMSELIQIIKEGSTNFSVASTKIFPEMLQNIELHPLEIAKNLNLIQNRDEDSIKTWIEEVLQMYPGKVENCISLDTIVRVKNLTLVCISLSIQSLENWLSRFVLSGIYSVVDRQCNCRVVGICFFM